MGLSSVIHDAPPPAMQSQTASNQAASLGVEEIRREFRSVRPKTKLS